MPNNPKVDINYPKDPLNASKEIETSLNQKKSAIDIFREREELTLLAGDEKALDASGMTPEQMETLQDWAESSSREEAEDAFALQQNDTPSPYTLTPEERLIRMQSGLDKKETKQGKKRK